MKRRAVLTKLFLLLSTSIIVASIYVLKDGIPHVGQLQVYPETVPMAPATDVTFTISVPTNDTFEAPRITLSRVDSSGDHFPLITGLPYVQEGVDYFDLYDDGTHGDKLEGDGIFSRRATLVAALPEVRYFQARASFSKYSRPIQSEIVALEVK